MPERNKLEIKKMKMSLPKIEDTLDEMTREDCKTPSGSVGLETIRDEIHRKNTP